MSARKALNVLKARGAALAAMPKTSAVLNFAGCLLILLIPPGLLGAGIVCAAYYLGEAPLFLAIALGLVPVGWAGVILVFGAGASYMGR